MALSITDTVHIFCAWLKAGRRRFMDADRAEIQGMVQLAGTIELLGVRPIEIRKFGPLGHFHHSPFRRRVRVPVQHPRRGWIFAHTHTDVKRCRASCKRRYLKLQGRAILIVLHGLYGIRLDLGRQRTCL